MDMPLLNNARAEIFWRKTTCRKGEEFPWFPKALNNLTVRSVFVIDPAKKLRLQITYPASTGRNFDEILRVIDSLQLTDHHQVATPVNWKDGEDCVVVPSIPTDEARNKFPKGVTEVRPYLRMTPQPNR